MIVAAIEIDGSTAATLQKRLVSTAYRLSRSTPVLLMLNGIDRERVDRILDDVVATLGTRFAGVRYVDGATNAELIRIARHGSAAVLTSAPRAFSSLQEAGVAAELLSEDEVLRRLETQL